MKVEEQYMDVLQNIEFGIVSTYRHHPEITDYEVMRVLEAVMDSYKAEKIGRAPHPFSPSNAEAGLFEAVRGMCEWRLGRGSLRNPGDEEGVIQKPKTIDEILLCLKRLLKSVHTWNREGGRKGYLNSIIQYVH